MEVKMNSIGDTPSQQIMAQAQAEVAVSDTRGRAIKLRKPGLLAQYRLIELLGETAKNSVYVSMVLPLLYVSAIDGDPVPAPNKKSEVEALIQRLDEEGVEAVMKAVTANFGSPDPVKDEAAIKN